jgi:glucose/arabinose dehydrogenase
LLAAVAVATCASACSFGQPPPDETGEPPDLPSPSSDSEAPDASVVSEVIAKDLEVPWGIAFLPDESALVTERGSAAIVSITPPAKQGDKPKVDKVQTIDEAVSSGEGGLLGIAVSPDYKDDETVFIYYTTAEDNRIASLKLGDAPEPIVTGIPKADHHNGGQLSFGPDGYLYATTGDAGDGEQAQDKKSLAGKVLRMTDKGKAPKDNPFKSSLVYSYGHRNSEGLAWNGDEELYATEFGDKEADEINKIEAGGNYGWPEAEGKSKDDSFVDPIVTWKPEEASCAGASFADKVLLTACLRGERLWTVEFTDKGTVIGEPTESLSGELGRLRAVTEAPDGTLWISTSNKDSRGEPRDGDDQIIRIVAGGSGEGDT